MALIQCPNCKAEVSDKATVCFSCGFRLPRPIAVAEPYRTPQLLKRTFLLGGGLVVVAFLLQDHLGAGLYGTTVGLGVLVMIGSILVRVLMRWVGNAPK